jgi:tetratricopeptide (TPR) repeat protein
MTGSGDDFDAAIAAFEAALTERTRERTPLDWANTKRNLALAQKKRGEGLDGPEAFDDAIANYQDALTVYSRDNSPIDWAQTEAILGIAALARADRSHSKADLKLAREAYAAAYEVFSQVDADYASYIKGKLKDIDKRLKR